MIARSEQSWLPTVLERSRSQGLSAEQLAAITHLSAPADQRLATLLEGATRRGELSLVYQPQFNLITGEAVGFEALMRWLRPEGQVSPLAFIPAAEHAGLMPHLGRWALLHGAAQAKRWGRRVSLNLSPFQIGPDLVREVEAVLQEFALCPSLLCFELTERSPLPFEPVASTLLDLHLLGVRLELDDYGTGYASLGFLRQLPFAAVKLDKSFLREVRQEEEPYQDSLTASVLYYAGQTAEALGLEVVVEGIESKAELELLRHLGFRFGQGYALHQPTPPEQIDPTRAFDL